jgi:hypothetical protein
MRNTHKTLVGKHDGETPLGRLWRRWEDNIRMDFRETGRGGEVWMHHQWLAVVNTVMNL